MLSKKNYTLIVSLSAVICLISAIVFSISIVTNHPIIKFIALPLMLLSAFFIFYMYLIKRVTNQILEYNKQQEELLKNNNDPSAKIVMLNFNQVKELEKHGAVKDEASGEIITKGV